MIDIGAVRTPDEFKAALQELLAASGRTTAELRRITGLSENTVRSAQRLRTFPHQGTVEVLVRKGCNVDPRPWIQAWHRASEARERMPQRSAQAELLEQLASQVEELSAELAAVSRPEAGPRETLTPDEEKAFGMFLTGLPRPDFEVPSSDDARPWDESFGYEITAVDALLEQIADLRSRRDVYVLAAKLASMRWEAQPAGIDAKTADGRSSLYERDSVDRYLLALNDEVYAFLRH